MNFAESHAEYVRKAEEIHARFLDEQARIWREFHDKVNEIFKQ